MDKIPDMEEMIEACRKKQKPGESIVFALGVGRMIPVFGQKKAMKKAMDYIKTFDGFLGIHPVDLWHNLLLFKELNDAKTARNKLEAKGISHGQVVPVLVPTVCTEGNLDLCAEKSSEK